MNGICYIMTSKKIWRSIIAIILIALSIIFSREISESIREGIKIAALSVIPAIFPFFVLSDYLSSECNEFSGSHIISKLFLIPESASGVIICGLVCGFPSGVRHGVRLYELKIITKEELERLIAIVNNPSLAFVISAVGLGLAGSITDGLLLFASLLLSVFLIARLTFSKKSFSKYSTFISGQRFDFVLSIKNAGFTSIIVSSYIIFFSAILGIIKHLVKSSIIVAIISSFLEIGNAVTTVTFLIKSPYLRFIFYGFALGFSGFSAHLQAFSFLPKEISKRKYLKAKFLQGITCSALTAILKTILSLI